MAGSQTVFHKPAPLPTVLGREEPIDPTAPICDAHQHFYDYPGSRYGPEDFLRDMGGGHNVRKTVYVQCGCWYRRDGPDEMKPVGETEFARTAAEVDGGQPVGTVLIAAGIVGFADLTLGRAVEPVLEAHIEAGRGHFRGIRNRVCWDPNPGVSPHKPQPKGMLLDAKFRDGFACLRRYGLSFDVLLWFHQLMELVDLARAFPDIPIVLNHLGGPIHIGPYAGKRDEVLEQWRRGIAALSACPNVSVKLGGLGLRRCGFRWHERSTPPDSIEIAEAMTPYLLWCIEHLGVDRCMFESNFPEDKLSYSYNVMWNAFKRVTRGLSPHERAALFHDTAVRVYGLD